MIFWVYRRIIIFTSKITSSSLNTLIGTPQATLARGCPPMPVGMSYEGLNCSLHHLITHLVQNPQAITTPIVL